ncbi:hypothetical protein TNCV_2300811 [Trichonephila clavipes]|nr:hypothetical protein TNCV_2300811 [Trichonephila clavipes]
MARLLFRVPPYHEGTIHLQTPMPSPGFEPRSHGIAASVANHYNGWAARKKVPNYGRHVGSGRWAATRRPSSSNTGSSGLESGENAGQSIRVISSD